MYPLQSFSELKNILIRIENWDGPCSMRLESKFLIGKSSNLNLKVICIEQKGPTISCSFEQTKDECGGLFGSVSRGQMMSDTKFLLPISDQLSRDQPLVTNLARWQNIQRKSLGSNPHHVPQVEARRGEGRWAGGEKGGARTEQWQRWGASISDLDTSVI